GPEGSTPVAGDDAWGAELEPTPRVGLPALDARCVDAGGIGDAVGGLDEGREEEVEAVVADEVVGAPALEGGPDGIDARGVLRGEVHALVPLPLGASGREVFVDEARVGCDAVEVGDDAIERRRQVAELVGEAFEARDRGGLDVGAPEDVGELEDVGRDDAEAAAFERTRDARGPGERVDRGPSVDPAAVEDVADESEEPGLVAYVTHESKYRCGRPERPSGRERPARREPWLGTG